MYKYLGATLVTRWQRSSDTRCRQTSLPPYITRMSSLPMMTSGQLVVSPTKPGVKDITATSSLPRRSRGLDKNVASPLHNPAPSSKKTVKKMSSLPVPSSQPWQPCIERSCSKSRTPTQTQSIQPERSRCKSRTGTQTRRSAPTRSSTSCTTDRGSGDIRPDVPDLCHKVAKGSGSKRIRPNSLNLGEKQDSTNLRSPFE